MCACSKPSLISILYLLFGVKYELDKNKTKKCTFLSKKNSKYCLSQIYRSRVEYIKSVHSYGQYETRYMILCCNVLQLLQILQIRLPVTSLFEKRWHTVTATHFFLNCPLSFLHLPQSCDILIPGPFSYPLSQLHRLFFRLLSTVFKIIIILFYHCYIYAFLLPSKDKIYMHKRTRTESPISHIYLAIK